MADNINLENLDIDKAMDLTGSQLESLGLNKQDIFDTQQKATFATDQALGVGAGALTGKKVDNSAIDSYIAQIEKPTGTDVYSKQAAMYRSQGEGALLRTQKNLSNLLLPTLDLIQKREAAAMARFTLLKNRMPEFDDTIIFGDQSENPMPISDEIKNISTQTKEDLRQLSRLNPMDERYEETKKRVEKNQKTIVEFDVVNQKLLEIRNSGTDESQWSKGMDETTTNMWRDIYSSNGKNIKIQDGKLVWTDEKGTTRNTYNIPDDNTINRPYDDETYEVLDNALVYMGDPTGDSEEYKRGRALQFMHWMGDQDLEGDDPASDYKPNVTKKIQQTLNTLGITDNDGNALEEDSKFGPKTRQAFKKYLKVRYKLNEQFLDKHMTEEDAEKYRTSKTTGVGETRTIDLSQIGDGPTMINNDAVNKEIQIRGNAQELINKGVGVDDPMYNTLIKQQIFELNNVGPDGIKSLIFDGLRKDETNLYNSINTDNFLEQVIENHYGNKLSESEIAEKIELMRAGDVTQMYNNGKGGQDTLQYQFMEWYKTQIDTQITEGKKSQVVPGGPPTGGGVDDGGGGGNAILNNELGSALQDNAVVYDYGSRGVQPYTVENSLNGHSLETGEIGITGENLKIVIDNDINKDRKKKYEKSGFIKSESTYKDQTYKLGTDNILYSWDSDEKTWVKSDFNADSNDPAEVAAYQRIIEAFDAGTQGAMGTVSSKIPQFDRYDLGWKVYGLNKQYPQLYKQGGVDFDWIRRENDAGKYIMDYDTNSIVISRMERAYKPLGFTFNFNDTDDELTVYFQDVTGGKKTVGTFKTDRGEVFSSDDRKSDENLIISAMKYEWELSDKYKQHFSKQRIEKDGNKYSIIGN